MSGPAASMSRRERAAAREVLRRQWSPPRWAEAQWSRAQLGDARLTARAVAIGTALARRPNASLPQQLQTWAALKAAYRLLSNQRRHPQVTFQSLSTPHWQATRAQAAQAETVLLLMDITELDYTAYQATMTGLAPIGASQRQRGLLLHSTLAVLPGPAPQLLGLMHQQLFKRVLHAPATTPKQRQQRPKAERESRVWAEAVQALGRVPAGVRWVVVADRGADDFEFMWQCQQQGYDFDLRMTYERRLQPAAPPRYLLSTARSWPAQGQTTVDVAERGGRRARRATVQLSSGPVGLREPSTLNRAKDGRELAVWVVRAWEVDPPPAGEEPLEWILATTVPVVSLPDALERVAWYRHRPIIEDYHQCLKTGTRAEQRDLEDAQRIERLLGFLAPLAVRMLQLRDVARQDPEAPARQVIDPQRLRLVAHHLQRPAKELTVQDFWRGVAQMGGYLGRKRDGPPGWKTLWRGWLELEALVRGAELGAQWAHAR